MRGYLENQPSRRQQRWAEQFWTFEAKSAGEAIILPDARSDLILKFNKRGKQIINILPIVSLPMTTPYLVEYKQGDSWIGVRLKPEQTCSMRQLTLDPQMGKSLTQDSADQIFAPAFASHHSIQTVADLHEILVFVLETLPVTAFPNWVRSSIDRFHLSGGRVDVAAIAAGLGISERHFRRAFSSVVHVSPKAYCSIIRFHRALRLITNGQLSISDVAFEAGYADHAHMTRAFQKFSGFAPSKIPSQLSLPGLPIN